MIDEQGLHSLPFCQHHFDALPNFKVTLFMGFEGDYRI